ncbi:nuclear transport factor 2 family protein [Pseudomonas gingeri]|uniref:Nuclear transport factor 2 family protein n=1 Tax=Pseudomonas gingeri TaxID=117681 RepID=A0A7Y7X9V2_9PSED|nr:nuclear transport factor 2 family protein [Pseudomonas gingeri]NWA28648.1 nuclear transport factor 2 family protein [Pseudomonas gingeri]NWB95725.1 nuclear transport factor 2 family protein [Pseudomonas gingeri]
MTTTTKKLDWAYAQSVLDVFHQYAWGYDSNDLESMGAAFAEDGVTGGVVTNSTSSWGPWKGRSEIVAGLQAIHDSQNDQRRHQITTPMFLSLSSEEAVLKAYLSCFATPPGGQPALVTTGEYLAQLSCKNSRWQIDRLDVVLDGDF